MNRWRGVASGWRTGCAERKAHNPISIRETLYGWRGVATFIRKNMMCKEGSIEQGTNRKHPPPPATQVQIIPANSAFLGTTFAATRRNLCRNPKKYRRVYASC